MKKLLTLLLTIFMIAACISLNTNVKVDAEGNDPTPLTFTAEEDNSLIKFDWINGSDVQIKASSSNVKVGGYDATGDWQDYTGSTEIKLTNIGDSVSFRGTAVNTNLQYHFKMDNGEIVASGDVTSLTNRTGGEAELTDSCYFAMFAGCTNLTTAPNLPTTALAPRCYSGMFIGCTNLTTAPVLSASTLASYCYYEMFYGCTNLEIAPELPATTLASDCYFKMFYGCTNLKVAPKLSAMNLEYECYREMFSGCSSLKNAPELPAKILTDGCYYDMFEDCTSLVTAPKLSATELDNDCYSSMFAGCTSLTTAPELPATELTDGCYYQMFADCIKLTATPELPATVLANSCYQNMFLNCTSLTTIPELPATTLADYCYESMFSGCTGLNISETKDENHQIEWSIPSVAEEKYEWNYKMFDKCGDNVCFSRTTSPVELTIGTTYYLLGKDFDLVTIPYIADQTYTGSKIEPELVVKYNDATLVRGTDYTVEYKDNTDVGTATVIVTGIGDYIGTKTATFKIVNEEIPDGPIIPYTGIQDANNFIYVSILTLGVYTIVKCLLKKEY